MNAQQEIIDRSDDYKAKPRERDREYRRKKRQNENEEERKECLIADLYYYSDMSDDKYFTMRDKKKMEIKMESNETRQRRLYNKRLSYSHCLSKLTEDERSAKQKSARERTARWKNEANNTEKDYKKAKHRDYMKRRRFYYEGKRSEREIRVYHFDLAKNFKLIPAKSHLDSDTGHEPFISYLIMNNLF